MLEHFALNDLAAQDGEGSQPRRTCHVPCILRSFAVLRR
jgi:hypothetical protein